MSESTSSPRPPTQVIVRRATEADLRTVVDIRVAVAGEGRWIGRELPIDVDDALAAMRTSLHDPAELKLVAEVDGLVVGDAGFRADGTGRADLYMALAEGHRGQGIGGRLLTEALAWARAQPDLHKATLQVWPHNVTALALYRRHGFVVEGYLHRHWRRRDGELWDAVVMGLLLVDEPPR